MDASPAGSNWGDYTAEWQEEDLACWGRDRAWSSGGDWEAASSGWTWNQWSGWQKAFQWTSSSSPGDDPWNGALDYLWADQTAESSPDPTAQSSHDPIAQSSQDQAAHSSDDQAAQSSHGQTAQSSHGQTPEAEQHHEEVEEAPQDQTAKPSMDSSPAGLGTDESEHESDAPDVDEDANMSGSDGSQGSEVSPAQTSAFMQLIRQSFPGRFLAPWAGVSKWGADSGPSDSPEGNGAEAAGDGPGSPEGTGAPDVGDGPGSPEYDPFEEDDQDQSGTTEEPAPVPKPVWTVPPPQGLRPSGAQVTAKSSVIWTVPPPQGLRQDPPSEGSSSSNTSGAAWHPANWWQHIHQTSQHAEQTEQSDFQSCVGEGEQVGEEEGTGGQGVSSGSADQGGQSQWWQG